MRVAVSTELAVRSARLDAVPGERGIRENG